MQHKKAVIHQAIMDMGNQRVNIRENSWMAWLAAKKLGANNMAITIGNTIHLHKTAKANFLNNERWVKHELKHIEQFRHYGYLKFIILYVVESARRGYYSNRFEVEARKAEESHIEMWGM